MLTKQHRFAASLVQEKQIYKTHMCGLCHALGDHYRLLSRLLTSHEMILLSLLTSAQRDADLQTVKRRCPLNPTHFVTTTQDEGSTFAAAAAVELARVSVLDDVQDSRGWDVLAQVSRLLIGSAHQTAVRTLENLGFDSATFARLTECQSQVEADSASDPAAPTAMTSASLFAMTARLAHKPENESSLAAIGVSYGAYLYLLDAYRDYPEDIRKGRFNPLRQFMTLIPLPPLPRGEQGSFGLTSEGLRWLLTRFETIRAEIQTQWPQVQTVRYRDSLEHLLLQPITEVIEELQERLAAPIEFRRWSLGDVVKAALFIVPAGMVTANIGDFEPVIGGEKRKRKPKPTEGASTGTDTACLGMPCYFDASAIECCDCEDMCDLVECAEGTPLDCTPGCDTDACSVDGCDGCDCDGLDCNT